MKKDGTKKSMEKTELSMDMLNDISGGYLTEDAEEYLHQEIGQYIRDQKKKKIQVTPENTSKYFLDNYDTKMEGYKYVTQEELRAYIIDNWEWF